MTSTSPSSRPCQSDALRPERLPGHWRTDGARPSSPVRIGGRDFAIEAHTNPSVFRLGSRVLPGLTGLSALPVIPVKRKLRHEPKRIVSNGLGDHLHGIRGASCQPQRIHLQRAGTTTLTRAGRSGTGMERSGRNTRRIHRRIPLWSTFRQVRASPGRPTQVSRSTRSGGCGRLSPLLPYSASSAP